MIAGNWNLRLSPSMLWSFFATRHNTVMPHASGKEALWYRMEISALPDYEGEMGGSFIMLYSRA